MRTRANKPGSGDEITGVISVMSFHDPGLFVLRCVVLAVEANRRVKNMLAKRVLRPSF